MIEAVRHAFALQRPLNFLVTIHLDKARVPLRAQEGLWRYLRSVGDWLGYYEEQRYYVWVLENPRGGLNAHILLHIPQSLWAAFHEIARQRDWLRALGAHPIGWKGVINVQQLTGSEPTDSIEDKIYNTGRIVLYLLKGVDETAAARFGIKRVPQGIVTGKRSGMSETLTPNARRRHEASLYPDEPHGGHVYHDVVPYSARLHLLSTFGFGAAELEWVAAEDGITDASTELFGSGRHCHGS